MQLPVRLRALAALPIRSIPIRLHRGPNAGAKWSLAASPLRYRAGTYEGERFEIMRRLLRPGDVFWDVGAHFGYASLMASRLVAPHGAVVSVEPSPYNRWYLEKHLRWNRVEATILPYALSDQDRVEVRFGGKRTSTTFRVGAGTGVATLRTIPSLLQEFKLRPPTVLKIDAEGSESAILRGAADVLLPETAMLVSIHSYDNYRGCRDLLVERGFIVLESRHFSEYLGIRDSDWPTDPDLLALGAQRASMRAEFTADFATYSDS